ncbi:MAG TPA: DUF3373 domain-containing protein [Sulfurihydrogenibium sp.]|uniref:cell division protein ZapB n=1 Tax=Sulfurihydrogenibium sp. (strain YO3AOP1) TaxID=436114 RepID=UPI0001725585|nr:cell division protein ZapB [Sulfurihydrogenibium sp. YO3AOP1]ACD66533.1 putative protein [Sulfurihydrogenibium sp. YO3AOP1]HBT98392.1 DUF3373 domain-containing protein [Sulfurihydrogenibium sp.]
MRKTLLSMALLSSVALAHASEDKIKILEDQIKLLQEEVQKLKQEQASVKEVKEENESIKEELRKLKIEIAMPELEVKSYYGMGPAASKAMFNQKGVSIGGYGEIHFVHNPDKKPKNTIDAKRLILYFGYAFNEKLKFNSEIEWEHAFVEGKEESGETAVEFAFIDYNFSQKLGLRGGLLLIPVGIVNEYHEPPTFPSVDRPYLERNIIPSTWRELGFGAYGKLGNLEYKAYITNGLKPNEEAGEKVEKGEILKGFRQNGFKAASDQIAFTGRLDYNLPINLKVGISGFFGGVQDDEGNKLGSINLLFPHLWWQYRGWDLRLVGAYGTTSGADKISQGISTNPVCQLGDTTQCTTFPKKFYGFYTQVAYDVLKFFKVSDQQLNLFGIYENYDTHASVPEGFEKPEGHKVEVYNIGLSYKPHPLVALKADYVRFSPHDAKKQNLYRFAIGWMF